MKPLIVGIAGGTGSGKSTVARRVIECLGDASVARVDMDAYYRHRPELSLDERRHINWDHPDALDLQLFREHLATLASGHAIEKPVYDYARHLRAARTMHVEAADVIVVDGILLFVEAAVRQLLDFKIFVDEDADLRLVRRIRRDLRYRHRPLQEILQQYIATVRPMHLAFVEPSRRWADAILPGGGYNAVATDMIVRSIRRRLADARA
ncbi:MAG: uridine kinase [Gemmatimonadaceae bacterium]